MRVFSGSHFEFSKSAILNFFCFISVKNPAHSYEVSFFSALWMVFPESWKRRVADFYAHDCKTLHGCPFVGWPKRLKGIAILALSAKMGGMACPVKSALKRTPVQGFNSFYIMFYYIISTTYQKIGDLSCHVHISGLSPSVHRAYAQIAAWLNTHSLCYCIEFIH